MNNRTFAILIIGLAITIGWFWHIAFERNWPVTPIGCVAYLALAHWLAHRLNQAGRR